jgi:hypothetical protein
VTHLTPALDATPADWIVSALRTFAWSVTSLVPSGFESYVRVFHPAYRRPGLEPTRVLWAEIAAATGKHVHPGMQLSALTGSDHLHDACPGVFDHAPEVGSLPPELAAQLAATLARHTATPDVCWLAVWYGFGALREEVRAAPMFRLPGREYHLLTGSVDAVTANVDEEPFEQTPNLWWPEDHAWCVATEVDLNSTYVGCDDACRERILALSEVEALPIDPATAIDNGSDLQNGVDKPPSRGSS